jgi:hypothetical protein
MSPCGDLGGVVGGWLFICSLAIRPVWVRKAAVFLLTVLYVGLWVGWTVWLTAEMDRNHAWP